MAILCFSLIWPIVHSYITPFGSHVSDLMRGEELLVEIWISGVRVDGILVVVFVQVLRGDLRQQFEDGFSFRDHLQRGHVVR